jgi:hypothetical protein
MKDSRSSGCADPIERRLEGIAAQGGPGRDDGTGCREGENEDDGNRWLLAACDSDEERAQLLERWSATPVDKLAEKLGVPFGSEGPTRGGGAGGLPSRGPPDSPFGRLAVSV